MLSATIIAGTVNAFLQPKVLTSYVGVNTNRHPARVESEVKMMRFSTLEWKHVTCLRTAAVRLHQGYLRIHTWRKVVKLYSGNVT
eukprot:g62186.t1